MTFYFIKLRSRRHKHTGVFFSFFLSFFWRDSPLLGHGLLIHEVSEQTQRRTTVGRTPLGEWSARRGDLYLTTHNTHNRQTSMPPVGFEPTISAAKRPQKYALERAATGTGTLVSVPFNNIWTNRSSWSGVTLLMKCEPHTSIYRGIFRLEQGNVNIFIWHNVLYYNFSKWPTWRTITLFYNTFITVLYMFRAT